MYPWFGFGSDSTQFKSQDKGLKSWLNTNKLGERKRDDGNG